MSTDATEVSYLVSRWSYSSMMMFLRNRFAFKKQYILKIYDYTTSVSATIGKAGHKALERYYNGASVDEAVGIGLSYINSVQDGTIEWGKTGSREKMTKDYTSAITAYLQEAPKYTTIEAVEKTITAFIDVNGSKLAIPAKSITDLLVRNESGELEIVDHKFVASYTDSEADKGTFVLQALFNYYTIKSEYGEAPKRMIFNECKIAKNRDGSRQLQPYVIEFGKHPEYFTVFANIYNDCTKEISKPDVTFLPNFDDRFGAEETFSDYKKQLITVDTPVVQHKNKHNDFAERQYVASTTNLVDNQYLPAEERIRLKLQEFGIAVEMQETYVGASVTQYTLKPSRGVKMSTIEKMGMDLAIVLKSKSVRIQAPIMGTDLVGVEIPNTNRTIVSFSDSLLEKDTLNIPIGVDVYNNAVSKSLTDMPHLLVAGATGAGKSVFINVAIKALTEQNNPDRMKLVLIDPKRVELSQYKNVPHLLAPVIYDEKKATVTLNWLVEEMEVRYQKLESTGHRNITSYNETVVDRMPVIVVVIDEFSDLILAASDVDTEEKITAEKAIIRLAQKARAIGIHLIIGTQRPSVDVVTGLIKANISTRIAFMTSSRIDSQVILDEAGAEELIGKGDMLFQDPHVRGLQRLQGYLL